MLEATGTRDHGVVPVEGSKGSGLFLTLLQVSGHRSAGPTFDPTSGGSKMPSLHLARWPTI